MLASVNAFLLHLLLFFVIEFIEGTLVDALTAVVFQGAQDYAHRSQDLLGELCECQEFSLGLSEIVEEDLHFAERDVLNPLRALRCQRG